MKAKYALKAMAVMARQEKKLMQARTIAEEANIPYKFLELILAELKNKGIISSKRGVLGGYHLSQSADKITLGDIIRTIDGPIAPLRCASLSSYQRCEDCTDEKSCGIRKTMIDVRIAISSVLDQRSLKDLVALSSSSSVDSLLQ
jgi:Rrf2 family protein